MSHFFNSLTHDEVLNACEHLTGLKLAAVCLMRNSYVNRVYEIEEKDSEVRWIVKFYRPGRWTKEAILDEHSFLFRLEKFEVAVIPPLVFLGQSVLEYEGCYVAFFLKKGGRAIDEFNDDQWVNAGRLLARIHLAGEALTSSHRTVWRPSVATQTHLDTLIQTSAFPELLTHALKEGMEAFIQQTDPQFEGQSLTSIHGDCHLGNFIYRPQEGLCLVDFDDCVRGPVIQDLWMLLPDEVDHCGYQIELFTEGYETFRPFPSQSLSLISSLKTMRQIHFAAWCALQKNEPHFQHHFPNWGTEGYWKELLRATKSAYVNV